MTGTPILTLHEQAKAAVDALLDRDDIAAGSRTHLAVLAWFDGYAAGHRAATDHAVATLQAAGEPRGDLGA